MKREQIQWGTRTLPISQFDLRPSATDENWFFCNISLFSSRTPKDDRNEIYRLWSEPEHIEPEKDKGKGPLKREATQFPGMEARSSLLEKMEPQFFLGTRNERSKLNDNFNTEGLERPEPRAPKVAFQVNTSKWRDPGLASKPEWTSCGFVREKVVFWSTRGRQMSVWFKTYLRTTK